MCHTALHPNFRVQNGKLIQPGEHLADLYYSKWRLFHRSGRAWVCPGIGPLVTFVKCINFQTTRMLFSAGLVIY